MNFGLKIREIRQSKGVSQQHIVRSLGKYTTWLAAIERGDMEIEAIDLAKVAKVLEVPVSEFFLPLKKKG